MIRVPSSDPKRPYTVGSDGGGGGQVMVVVVVIAIFQGHVMG